VQKLLNLVVSGAVSGAIYSLIASGLVLTYTATGIFNLAYGAIAFCTAFLYFELHTGVGWPIVPAAIVSVLVFAPLLGLLLDVAIFRPLARATDAAKVMATVGLLIALPALMRFVVEESISLFDWDIPDGRQVLNPPGIGPAPKHTWKLPGSIVLDSNQIIVFGAAAICAVGLWIVMRHTTLGLRMRAVVDRGELADARGVDRGRTSAAAWVIGMVLAGLAGVIGAPILNSLDANTYTSVLFVATAAAVLGGMRSIPLAFLGGLLLGVAQNLVAGYVTEHVDIRGFTTSVPFVLLLVGMLVIARDRSRRGGSVAEDRPPPDHADDLAPIRRAAPWALAVAFLVVYLFFLADEFWIGLMTQGLCLGIIFLSFVVVTGMGGYVSLAQATYVTAAGLTAGVLINRYDVPFLVGLLGGMAVAMLLAVVVALPALRLGGLPLALCTLALAFLGDLVLFQWNWFRHFEQGWTIPRLSLGPVDLEDDRSFAVFLLVLLGLLIVLVTNLRKSPWGRAITAMRSSELAASTSGISPVLAKLAIFTSSAALAGLGGVFLFSFNKSAVSNAYPTQTGLLWLATVVLFGIRRPGGAMLAGIVSASSATVIRSGIHIGDTGWDGTKSIYIPAILFGLGAVQLARNADGILAITAAQNRARRHKRALRAAGRAATATGALAPSPLDAVVAAEQEAAAAEVARHEADLVAAQVVHAPLDPEAARAAAELAGRRALLRLHDVSAAYGDVQVLHDVDLAVREGTITALLGANGAGKSTLCSVISGQLPVTAGRVELADRDVTALRGFERARAGVVLAPEQRGIFPGLSVEENLQVWLPTPGQRDEAFDRFPVLKERRAIPAGSLSGGEQQMLTLVPLLVRPPEVLVADEPSLGLAPLVVQQILRIFLELRDRGTALLLVEEKARDVLEVADFVVFLELGRIGWTGLRAEVDDERLAAAYLGALARTSR
jgi:ABC-type branched-subunit amino acid transport system ATPase component/branched-subunit amino acid ABC-type transport system permease component